MSKDKILMSSNSYTSIQEAVNQMKDNETLVLENKIYAEGLVIDKSVHILGQDESVLVLSLHQLHILNGANVTFENVVISVEPIHFDAHIMIKDAALILDKCAIQVLKPGADLYACIWSEHGSLSIYHSNIKTEANLIKSVHGDLIALKNNHMILAGGQVALEGHQTKMVCLEDNEISSAVHMMRLTKVSEFLIKNNQFVSPKEPRFHNGLYIFIDGIEQGDISSILNNVFSSEKALNIVIKNSLSVHRKIEFAHNKMTSEMKSGLKFEVIQGLVEIQENDLSLCQVSVGSCSEVMVQSNRLGWLLCLNNRQLMIGGNKELKQVVIETSYYTSLKNNEIHNDGHDTEAVSIKGVDKLVVEHNRISSVDHGMTLLNGGDNLETIIRKNTFEKCRKRSLNIVSTTQKKYLKTELQINNNVFLNNDKAIHLDDKNLKSCHMEENYFGENQEAILIIGGKATSHIQLIGNYFSPTMQKIELRNGEICSLTHNALMDSKMILRGCDEILIHGNLIDNPHYKKGKFLHNDVCIKSGGRLTISHNTILKGKIKQAKKEIYEHLNITSYERHPSVNIHDNLQLEGYRKRSFFQTERTEELKLYPDESLLSMLKYEGDSEHNLNLIDMDDRMRQQFFNIRNQLIEVKERLLNGAIAGAVDDVIGGLKIELLAGRDSNDIYRFIAKSNETIEMLKIYTSMANRIDGMTEKRILSVLKSYMMVVEQFSSKRSEDEEDKLKAQLNLLENLL